MDKRSILAIILVTIIILLLPKYYDLIYDKPIIDNERLPVEKDIYSEEKKQEVKEKPEDDKITATTEEVIDTYDRENGDRQILLDSIKQSGDQIEINLETPLVSAKISNMGGGNIVFWYLKKYDTWLNEPVKIVAESIANGPDIKFLTVNGEKIDLNNYSFFCDIKDKNEIKINPGERLDLQYHIKMNETMIKKIFTFYADFYHIDINIVIENPKQLLLNNEYQIGWINGLISNEENIEEDY